jgi:1-acyl-sn-glycerol-3-phosphate acyltransferase
LGGASLLLSVAVLPALGVLPGTRERKEVRAQRILHSAIRVYLRGLTLLGVLRVRATGAERLLRPGALVVANHPTLLDALALMSLMPQADCVVKARYFDHPLLCGVARAAGYIRAGAGPEVVAAAVERLVRGRSLIIFPEGTRSPARGLAPFLRGAAHIALRAGRDPIPVLIRCEPPTLHHGRRWWDVPERRFDLDLCVGEPLRVKDAVGDSPSRSQAARALTRSIHDHFSRYLPLVDSRSPAR